MNDLPRSASVLLAACALFFGASLGSFLNVVVARLPHGLSVVRPGSRCPRCLEPIAWHDNVPVLSWLLLRGRCRRCRTVISARYPLVELLGAGAALLALRRHGLSGSAAAELAFAAMLLALAFIDLDTWLLPNALTWPLLAGGLALSALGLSGAPSLAASLWGAAAGFAAFAAIAVVGKRLAGREAMGFGDVWLLAGLGAFLGVGAIVPVVLLASIQGTAVGLALGAMGKLPKGEQTSTASPTATTNPTATAIANPTTNPTASAAEEEEWVPPRNAVPFGPFLVAGALEWLYLGGAIARLAPALELFR